MPPPGYLAGVRELCDRYGIMLILDEVMAGFGRTGRWFAFEGYDVVPDLITFAKGVNSGYVPVGGVIISDEISATFDDRVFPGGLTYSGHPLAAASIIASIDAMEAEGIVENARRIGADGDRARAGGARRRSIRSSARCAARACSGRSSWSPTAPRASPSRRRVIGQLKKELHRARPGAVRRREPHPRRAAVRRDRRRGRAGDGDLRRGPHRRRGGRLAALPAPTALPGRADRDLPWKDTCPRGGKKEDHDRHHDPRADDGVRHHDPRPLGRRRRLGRRIHAHRAVYNPALGTVQKRGAARLHRRRRRRRRLRVRGVGGSGATPRSRSARRCCSRSASC